MHQRLLGPDGMMHMLGMRCRSFTGMFLMLLPLSLGCDTTLGQDSTAGQYSGVAVVELFTSQGCSSCPPADQTLAALKRRAEARSLKVYCLSFHVDYWNRLGWTDPYSSAAYSNRQRAYSRSFQSNRVYTPQMIVSGTDEFVGSNGKKAVQVINGALQQSPQATVTLRVERPDPSRSSLTVHYQVDGKTAGQILHLALVHSPQANHIPRGENAGRDLEHVNVVRDFESVKLTDPAGSAQLSLPPGLSANHAKVIAYVQDSSTSEIVGANDVAAG